MADNNACHLLTLALLDGGGAVLADAADAPLVDALIDCRTIYRLLIEVAYLLRLVVV